MLTLALAKSWLCMPAGKEARFPGCLVFCFPCFKSNKASPPAQSSEPHTLHTMPYIIGCYSQRACPGLNTVKINGLESCVQLSKNFPLKAAIEDSLVQWWKWWLAWMMTNSDNWPKTSNLTGIPLSLRRELADHSINTFILSAVTVWRPHVSAGQLRLKNGNLPISESLHPYHVPLLSYRFSMHFCRAWQI